MTVLLKGVNPLIMHNGKILKNPLHPLTKEIKRFSGKRTKSDDDLMAIAKLEWFASLYLMERGNAVVTQSQVKFDEASKQPCLPGDVLEAMLFNTAKKQKLGTQFKAAIVVDGNFPLEYSGAKTLEELWSDERFVDIRDVRLQGRNSVMRCRPIFPAWAVTFTISYLSNMVNKDQIVEILELAGVVNGLGDYRPKYGRFQIAA